MKLEHVNITVSNPDDTAATLCHLFDWQVRWAGAAKDDGYTVHVGDADSYLALYRPNKALSPMGDTYSRTGGMNHLGIIVDDIATTEARVKTAGYRPHNHADYEPGLRFYFDGPDGIEIEVVQYPA